MPTFENCISCGMPLRAPEDHAASDVTKDYCVHCATPSGELKSYDEALAGMTAFLTHTQGLDEHVARDTAKRAMAQMPAWRAGE